jgi:hypothetical protein
MATYLHKFGVFYFDWFYLLMWTIWFHLGLGVPLVVGGVALVGKYYYHP